MRYPRNLNNHDVSWFRQVRKGAASEGVGYLRMPYPRNLNNHAVSWFKTIFRQFTRITINYPCACTASSIPSALFDKTIKKVENLTRWLYKYFCNILGYA
jgi:hypothetical protein